jgi:DNA topoisomerase I
MQLLLQIPKKEITAMAADAEKCAEAVNLIYVTDSQPGILRKKKGKGFIYVFNDKVIKEKNELQRIKKLVIPPAWKNVWICSKHDGHLQATGMDVKNRKQYRYHPLWNELRNQTKFYRLLDFGKTLPTLRLQVEKDIALHELSDKKVLAAVISLMERTYIRIGNTNYEKLYGSYGLTTLKDKHVKINGNSLRFSFVGKKGIVHEVNLKNKRLARIVKQCRDIPGKDLFQYTDETGVHHGIDSGKVNSYIKEITGKDFTAKDFRTWAGTLNALRAFKNIGIAETQTETKKKIVEALDFVSRKLGNTRTVCKKYYVHPVILTLYENQSLKKYLDELDAIEKDDDKADLAQAEKILMKILSAA